MKIINPNVGAPTLAVHAEDGRVLLAIHQDGTVTGEVEDANEAGARFVAYLRGYVVEKSQGEHFHIWSEPTCRPGECRMEPQGEPTERVIVMCARCGLFPVVASDQINSDIVACDRCAFAEGRESVQGEPSDAQVEAGCAAFYEGSQGLTSWARLMAADPDLANRYRDGIRAALRAAYEVRGEGR